MHVSGKTPMVVETNRRAFRTEDACKCEAIS